MIQEKRFKNKIQALIITPTRELAIQINENITDYAKYSNIKNAVIFGGVKQGPQLHAVKNGIDILIATPGRLLDLINQGFISLINIRYFVLDEADRMLDMGFEPQLNEILDFMPKQITDNTRPLPSSGKCNQYSRQTLLFSATWPKSIRRIGAKFTHNPIQLNVGNYKKLVVNEKIEQTILILNRRGKVRRKI